VGLGRLTAWKLPLLSGSRETYSKRAAALDYNHARGKRQQMNWKPFSVLGLLILATLVGTAMSAKTYPLASEPGTPAASGKVDVGKDKSGNVEVTIRTEHLAKPGMLTPPATAYVIWFQEQASDPANQGQLMVANSLKSEFKTTTQFKNFDIFITAEGDPMTKVPSGQVVLRTKVQM
jgi:hypothetical protein